MDPMDPMKSTVRVWLRSEWNPMDCLKWILLNPPKMNLLKWIQWIEFTNCPSSSKRSNLECVRKIKWSSAFATICDRPIGRLCESQFVIAWLWSQFVIGALISLISLISPVCDSEERSLASSEISQARDLLVQFMCHSVRAFELD